MQGRSAEAPAQVVHRRKRIRKFDDDVEKFIDSERPEALVNGVLETTAPLRGARLVQTERRVDGVRIAPDDNAEGLGLDPARHFIDVAMEYPGTVEDG